MPGTPAASGAGILPLPERAGSRQMEGPPPLSAMTRARFPAQARLHRPSEFAAALKGRRLARGAMFVVSAAAPADETDPTARLGLVIAKRFAPLATTRNAIKRVLREAFRHQRPGLPARDYVVRLHSRVTPATLTALKRAVRSEADALFGRISK
ncbi:ribonuclease P [Bordetella trematum]|nr:ribonuclease P protein component [Bordetella trematum]VDH04981.1 ribonuclease P [Bordetella trematum]